MNPVQRFFHKYFISTIAALTLFLLINLVLVVAIRVVAGRHATAPDLSVSALSAMVSEVNGVIEVEPEVSRVLAENRAWAMLLDDGGAVIWEEQMPEDLPRSYTAAQIAQFSRWYLQEYPVFVWQQPAGLFVLAYPANSLQRYNFAMETGDVWAMVITAFGVFLASILLMLFLLWRSTRRVERAMKPILTGISAMAQGKPIQLEEHGELADINAELNRASEQLHKKDTARADWISGISHDIRTPLSVMLGYAGEIEDNDALPSDVQKQAGLIRKHGEKLRQLILDLNLTSRLEYAMQPLQTAPVSPVELSRQVVSGYVNDGLDGQYEIDLYAGDGAETILIECDNALLTRMLENLIGNSITHNPEGCHICVSVESTGGTCTIIVQDTGKGMDEVVLRKLNAAECASFTQSDGSGIPHGNGLNIAKQIVSAHRGTIRFFGTEPHGLTVAVKLPIPTKL